MYSVMSVYLGPNVTETVLNLEQKFRDCWSNDPTQTAVLSLLQQMSATFGVVNSPVFVTTVAMSFGLVSLLFLFGMLMEIPSSAASLRKRIADKIRTIDIRVCHFARLLVVFLVIYIYIYMCVCVCVCFQLLMCLCVCLFV